MGTDNMQHLPFRDVSTFLTGYTQKKVASIIENIPECFGFEPRSWNYFDIALGSGVVGIVLLEKQIYFKGFRHPRFDIRTNIPVLELGLAYFDHETSLKSLRIVAPPLSVEKSTELRGKNGLTREELDFKDTFFQNYLDSLQIVSEIDIPGSYVLCCEPQIPSNETIEHLEKKLDTTRKYNGSVPVLISQDAESFADVFLV